MFEQDYVMRQIKEIVRAVLKLMFDIETDGSYENLTEFTENAAEKELLTNLLDMADKGDIDGAEKLLREKRDTLKTALLFYSYLNGFPDEFFEGKGCDRENILMRLTEILEKHNLGNLAGLILFAEE